ncbi:MULTISPECIES: MaoC family dehydratase [Colwellia]|uniref:MaoC domain protein n=1 Tax=Colwellia psychrerythraea (strain 34H / ATCC BAA-681) TaxID=167879 RepID=Q488V0_COLP3|nr:MULTISPECIES: MaoC family dehydratase [Colwellia]AAZ27186.1 MaoC domain protein [Colwellia psychrerythraea 34H]PKH86401.1 dehydratase [Colwellia sp. Bg11-28]
MIGFDEVQVGDELPVLQTKVISRTTLALFAGASGDHNPMHIDIDFAKKAGMNDVFAHGMLSAAYLGRLLTGWVAQTAIKKIDVRFTAITQLFAEITCSAIVKEKFERDGSKLVLLLIDAKDQNGDIKISGSAEIALN